MLIDCTALADCLQLGDSRPLLTHTLCAWPERGATFAMQVAEDLQLEGAQEFLESDEGQEEIMAADAAAKQRSIRGVPYYMIGTEAAPGKHVLSGAQAVNGFLEVFARSVQSVAEPHAS